MIRRKNEGIFVFSAERRLLLPSRITFTPLLSALIHMYLSASSQQPLCLWAQSEWSDELAKTDANFLIRRHEVILHRAYLPSLSHLPKDHGVTIRKHM